MTARPTFTTGCEPATQPAPVAAPAQPTISLVIPAHDEEAYIGACLDAVMAHVAGRVCEIMVVDNDSSDGTSEIVRGYERVTYVFEPSKGITKARERGYRHARGDILAFVDADTIPPAGWIERIDEQFRRDSALACISGPYRYYDLPRLHQFIGSAWFVAAWPVYRLFGYLVVGGNFAIRRSVLDAMGGFDTTIEFYGEDADIARRARKFGRVLFMLRLVMPTSGRRLKREGYLKMAGIYLINFLSIAFRGKPATHDYTDVR